MSGAAVTSVVAVSANPELRRAVLAQRATRAEVLWRTVLARGTVGVRAAYASVVDAEPVCGVAAMACELTRRLRVVPADPLARIAIVRALGWSYRPGEWFRGEERAASVDAVLERMGVGP